MEDFVVIMGALGGLLAFFWIILLALIVVGIVSSIFLFRKMALPGWWGIIPFWNVYNICKMTWSVTPWFWVYLALFIVVYLASGVLASVAAIASLVLAFAMNLHLARGFGKDVGYCIGLTLLPIVFMPMLAFGSAQYVGNKSNPEQL